MGALKGLTEEVAWRIKGMYEEVDGQGRRVWSQRKLAEFFSISETTVFRVVNSTGGYRTLPKEIPTEAEMKRRAEESLKILQEKLRENPPASVLSGAAARLIGEEAPRVERIPASPLDGGDGGEEGASGAVEKLQQEANRTNGDLLIQEMNDGK